MRKHILVFVLMILTAVLLLNSCGKDPYAEAAALNKEFITVMKNYLSDMEKADSAESVARTMNTYADGLEELWPEMKNLSKRHPELQNKEKQPEELQKLNKEAEDIGNKMGMAFGKVMKYMDDEYVQKAQARIRAIMM